jgi:hypothetical protein
MTQNYSEAANDLEKFCGKPPLIRKIVPKYIYFMAKVIPEANYGRAVAKIYQCQGKNMRSTTFKIVRIKT